MNNTIISTVTEHKHFGLQLSDDGNWNKHIDMTTKKAFCSLVFESWYPKQHPHILVMVL
jgi:hypothetical protein